MCLFFRVSIFSQVQSLGQSYHMPELDLKNIQTTLLDLYWFYVKLDLNLKNTWANWIQIDFIIIKQGWC